MVADPRSICRPVAEPLETADMTDAANLTTSPLPVKFEVCARVDDPNLIIVPTELKSETPGITDTPWRITEDSAVKPDV